MAMEFRPIQENDLSLAFQFLQDAFRISFGEESSRWPGQLGELDLPAYSDVIRKKLAKDPESAIHLWQDGRIIGQIEISIKKEDPTCGYVSLFYLIPEKRGAGLGSKLDQYAIDKFRKAGCRRMELTVEPANQRAIEFYRKQGWVNLGPHPVYTSGLLMEKIISSS